MAWATPFRSEAHLSFVGRARLVTGPSSPLSIFPPKAAADRPGPHRHCHDRAAKTSVQRVRVPPLRASTMTSASVGASACRLNQVQLLAKSKPEAGEARLTLEGWPSKAAQKKPDSQRRLLTGHDTAGEVKGGNLRGRHRAGQIGTRR